MLPAGCEPCSKHLNLSESLFPHLIQGHQKEATLPFATYCTFYLEVITEILFPQKLRPTRRGALCLSPASCLAPSTGLACWGPLDSLWSL